MTNNKFTSNIKILIINLLKKTMVNTTLYNALLPIQKEKMIKLLLIITEITIELSILPIE